MLFDCSARTTSPRSHSHAWYALALNRRGACSSRRASASFTSSWDPLSFANGTVGVKNSLLSSVLPSFLCAPISFHTYFSLCRFSSADLRMAAEIVVRVCANAARSGGQVQWDDIHGLLSHTIYGGRIDSPFDFAVLQTCVLGLWSSLDLTQLT